ncbi:MAG: zf-HC2 domain-containing protein [Lachnospiraceae bacterium]|nr:zf-HC2 domain-containing protein [Lachnospiraceae bacterium]
MKISCGVIRDLLFLYEEDGCSAESRELVEAHLKECDACRSYQRKLRVPCEMVHEEKTESGSREALVIKKSFRKIRRRWLASLLAVFLIFPVIGLGMMGYNEYRKEGICFTNLDEIYLAWRFLSLVEDGSYERAAEMVSYKEDYQSIMEVLDAADQRESWLDHLTERTLNGESWLLKPYLSSYFSETDSPDEEWNLWGYLIYNGIGSSMVPEEIWETVVGFDNTEYRTVGAMMACRPKDVESDGDSSEFYRVETQWGVYYVNGALGEMYLGGEIETAADIYEFSGMIPERIFADAKEEVIKRLEEDANCQEELFGGVRELTEEEFCAFMRKKLVKQLEEYQSCGSSFELLSLTGAYGYDGKWDIRFGIDETIRGESRVNYQVMLYIRDGEICRISWMDKQVHVPIGETSVISGALNANWYEISDQ